MIRRIVTALILLPLAIIVISFAVANRQSVVVSFDPFDQAHPALTRALPLYLLMLMLLIGGVVVGGIAAWVRQGKWRRAARHADAQARELRAEVDRLKRRLGASASMLAASSSSLASTESATFCALPRTRSPSARAASTPTWRGEGAKKTKPTRSAPASSATSSACDVFRPQILTRTDMARDLLRRGSTSAPTFCLASPAL